LALRIGEHARAECMLERAARRAGDSDAREHRTWVLSRLADCKRRSGDIKAAITQLRDAAGGADPAEAAPLYRELAELAAGPGGDLEIAASAYTSLLERDPTDRSLWQ